ncbi:MAG: amidase, partial [Candidatus Neomarinimicrobiota bacterium]|nr:amidase [Candidatus Neomarinimicrobiota bacterium]
MKKILLIITTLFISCEKREILKNDIISSEKIMGIEFSSSERDSLLNTVSRRLDQYRTLREIDIPNNISFPLFYDPLPVGMNIPTGKDIFEFREIKTLRPKNLEKCAFMTIPQLAYLIRTKQVSSEELTRMYLDRLKRYQNDLQCTVTLTESLAIEQARKA